MYDEYSARRMGIEEEGQVCVMIHSGSRGLGHQVATDALVAMEAAMSRDQIKTNDRQLACARIDSPEVTEDPQEKKKEQRTGRERREREKQESDR